MDQRLTDRQTALGEALDANFEQDIARGISTLNNQLSAANAPTSSILRSQGDLVQQAIVDLNVIKTQSQLQNEQFLQSLAMEDLQTEQNRLQSVIQLALEDKGIDAGLAAEFARIEAASRQQALASQFGAAAQVAGIGGQLASQQIGASTGIASDLLRDEQQALANQLATEQLGLGLLQSVMSGVPGIGTSQSTGSK